MTLQIFKQGENLLFCVWIWAMKKLRLIAIETHVADARSCCLHPANATHRQMSEEELIASGVPSDLVRLSCGLENYQDLIDDIQNALESI